MATYQLTLDRRTLLGKNVFNFLMAMNYVDEANPTIADVDERTADGKKVMQALYALGIVKSPYNPDFVAKIKKSERQIASGMYVKVTDVNKYINEL